MGQIVVEYISGTAVQIEVQPEERQSDDYKMGSAAQRHPLRDNDNEVINNKRGPKLLHKTATE